MLIQVTFVGAGAVDTGGPRREFLRLLVTRVTSSPYIHSGSDGSFFAWNTTGYKVSTCGFLPGSEFFFVNLGLCRYGMDVCIICKLVFSTYRAIITEYWGMYAAISVAQGGPGFPLLHPAVYMYICTAVWVTSLHSHYKHSRPCLEKHCIKGKHC